MKNVCLLAVLKMLLVASAHAENVEIYYDYKPFAKDLEASVGSGLSSITTLRALENISVEHSFQHLPFDRIALELKTNNKPACSLFKIKNDEREEQFLFSLPLAFQSNYRLYMQAYLPEPPANLVSNGEVSSLDGLLKFYPSSKLVLTEGISYGEELDQILEGLDASQVIKVRGVDRNAIHARMFAYQRADFTVAFPAQMNRFSGARGNLKYESLRIKELPTLVSLYIMCNTHPQSEAFLQEVNKNVVDMYFEESFLETHLQFQPAEEHKLLTEKISLIRKQMSKQE
uniref:hypothetical protein n=1 Tax=Ningiella ruwaisensis TaxID=2364274 RepID=UPI00109F5F1B|nr:hypothetical protein [Ningiella ruwaisensis]